jgi:hypothetical protein
MCCSRVKEIDQRIWELKSATPLCRARRVASVGLLMDILASIFAYFTCVAGIIGAFALSIFVLFSAPDHASVILQNSALTTKHAAAVFSAATDNVSPAATATKRAASAQTAGTPEDVAATPVIEKRKPSRQVSAAQLRRLARQEHDKRVAYQQDADFDARFLGYAD